MAEDDIVGVVGLGYAGLPLTLAIADAGYEVIGVDVDEKRILTMKQGRSLSTMCQTPGYSTV